MLLLCCLGLLFAAQPIDAHGYIIRAIPEDRAVMQRSPARVQYWFSEDLEPQFSSVTVRDRAGEVLAEGRVDEQDRTLLSAKLPGSLPQGAYVSELRIAFASDGHVIVETRVFFIGEPAGELVGQMGDDTAVLAEVVWRTMLLSSTMVLFGAFTLYTLVLLPAWRNNSYRAGLLPPRVMRRLNVIVAVALITAFVANILGLLQQTSVFFGADLGRVLNEGLWNVVRIGTRFGDTWNVRTILLVLVAAIYVAGIIYSHTQPEIVRPGWTANTWASALVLGVWSVASHAAGSQVLPWIALFSDWLHGLAVGFWVGALIVLTLILPSALAPYSGDEKRVALFAVLRRFSYIALTGLVLVVATGIYNAFNWFTTPSDFQTTYGMTLIVKVVLVGLLLAVGTAHHVAVTPERYARWSRLTNRMGDFLPTLRVESLLALILLALAAALSATPPPKPNVFSPPPILAEVTFSLEGEPFLLSISPGGMGVNTYDIQFPTQPAEGTGEVYVRLINPESDLRGKWHRADPVGDKLFSAAGADIDRVGRWWMLVEVGGIQSAVALEITADSELLRSRAPNLLNLMALTGVVVAGLFAVFPLLRRLYHRLDLSPSAVAVAVIASAVALGIVIIGLWATMSITGQQALLLSPPPTVINVRLPTNESINMGESVFVSTCPQWIGTRDFDELIKRLERLRDDDLYHALVQDGWWDLPPCLVSLDEALRWDVVNYVRSLESKT